MNMFGTNPPHSQQPTGAVEPHNQSLQYRLDAPLPTQVSAPAPRIGVNRPSELMIARVRRHGRGVVLPSIACIIGAGLLGYSTVGLRESGAGMPALLGGLALVLLLGLVPIAVWLRHRYSITSMRTIRRGGFGGDRTTELLHHQVASVTTKQNAWQKLFGSGDIRLTGFDGRILELNDVPNMVTISGALRELSGANGE